MNVSRESVEITGKVAIVTTSAGVIHAYFYPDVAPNHVRNFLYLAQKGFYSNVPFHRVVEGFVIQAGKARADWREKIAPLKAEFSKLAHQAGTIAAARTSDPNSATSQFYFVISRTHAHHLDNQYTVFGQAFRGIDVIETIADRWVAKTKHMSEREADAAGSDDRIEKIEIVDAAPFAEEIEAFRKTLVEQT